MRLTDKYLLGEYLLHLTFCVVGFSMIFVIWDLFDHLGRLFEAKVAWQLVLKYYVCLVLPTLEYLLPSSLLLATLYTLWQMARNNELTAMRASGISLYRLLLPFMAVGLIVTLLTAIVKEFVAPPAALFARECKDKKFEMAERDPPMKLSYVNIDRHLEWHIGQFRPGSPRRLEDVEIKWDRDGDITRTAREMHADRAEWLDGKWWFFGVREKHYTQQGYPIGDFKPVTGGELGVTMPGVTDRPSDFVIATKDSEFMSGREIWRYMESHPNISSKRMAECRVDLHTRVALPWACFILTLFGIPAGGLTSRQGVVIGIMSAVAMLLGFYGLTIFGIFMGKSEMIPAWLGAWFPNIVFLTWGLNMMRKMR